MSISSLRFVALKQMEDACVFIAEGQMVTFVSNPTVILKLSQFAKLTPKLENILLWIESTNRKTVETLELWAETHGMRVQRGKCGGVELYKYDPLASQSIEGRQIIDLFRQAMQAGGVPYSGEIIPDGEAHYFDIDGDDPGSLNGSYSLGLGDRPYGWIESSKTGFSGCWIYSRKYGTVSQHTNKKEGACAT